jgi:hypothetical protein
MLIKTIRGSGETWKLEEMHQVKDQDISLVKNYHKSIREHHRSKAAGIKRN